MANNFKKSGQKFLKKLTRFSLKAGAKSKEHLEENFVERIPHVRTVRLLIVEWALLVLIIIFLSITQAIWYANSYSSNSFVSGGTYIEATLGEVKTLNPLFATTNSEKVLSKLLFATLSATDYTGHAGLGLADSISVDSTGKIWTVKLRDGLKWSDGEEINNDDVIFTFNLIKNTAISTIYSSYFSGVSAEVVDGKIIFTLSAPYADFASALEIPILPEHILGNINPKLILENQFSSSPITSGAFTFNASQNVSAEGEIIIYLSPNPHYYKGKPLLNSFAVHAFLTIDDIVNAINSNTVSGTAELTPADSAKVKSNLFYEKQTAINSGVYAFLNCADGVFTDKTLRKAVQSGINLERIRSVLNGEAALDYPILGTQIELSGYPDLPAFDKESAIAAVAEAIAKLEEGEHLAVNVATLNSGYLPEVANKLIDELKSLGFETNLMIYENNQDLVKNAINNRAYDILIYETKLGNSPDLLAYYHSSQATSAGLNLSNYKNTIVDDLILAARESTDIAVRNAKYSSFLERWVSDAPAIGLYQVNMSYFINKNARAFSENAHLASAIDRFVNVENWAAAKSTKFRTP